MLFARDIPPSIYAKLCFVFSLRVRRYESYLERLFAVGIALTRP